jgi:hypothetical protein
MGILLDKSISPGDQLLKDTLGTSFKLWEEIKKGIIGLYSPVTEEWKYYGAKSGWTMKLLYKKRNLFFFIPSEKYFTLGFVFGDKAVKEVEKSSLPKPMIEELLNAKKYAEGRGLRVVIKKKGDLKDVFELVRIKIEN